MEKLLLIFSLLFLNTISAALQHKSQICKSRTRILNDGDRFEPRRCFFCECRNQTLTCGDQEPDVCPEPSCKTAVQISTSDRCCKICPGVGARCRFNGMSVEDGESFQLDPCGACECFNGKLTCSKCPSKRSTIGD